MPEGDTAVNPTTGERVILRGGKWVPLTTNSPPPSAPNEKWAARERGMRQGSRTAGATFISNILSIPHASGELLANAAALPALIPGGKSFTEAREEHRKAFPASALLAIPDVTSEQVLAVPGAIGRTISNMNANRARALAGAWDTPPKNPSIRSTFPEALAQEQQRSADHPIATTLGRVGGDVATALVLKPGERIANSFLGPFNPRAAIPEGGGLATGARTLARGLGRAAEAGIDSAALSAMGGGDPAQTAAYSAGIQAVGSAALSAKGWVWRNPGKTALSLWLGHEIWKAVMPGPQDAFESKDQVIRELVSAYGAGTAAAMLGAGRGIGEGNVRRVTDAMSTASRATIASVITQLQTAHHSGNAIPSKVLEMMGADPNRFGADVRERLERAAASEKPQALLKEIDDLMKDEKFRQALGESPKQSQPSFGEWLLRRNRGG